MEAQLRPSQTNSNITKGIENRPLNFKASDKHDSENPINETYDPSDWSPQKLLDNSATENSTATPSLSQETAPEGESRLENQRQEQFPSRPCRSDRSEKVIAHQRRVGQNISRTVSLFSHVRTMTTMAMEKPSPVRRRRIGQKITTTDRSNLLSHTRMAVLVKKSLPSARGQSVRE
jgi:hypothetical protein